MEPTFNLKESAAQGFYNQLSKVIEIDYQKEMITELFKKLVGDSVTDSHFAQKEGKIEVSVTLENSIDTALEGKTLHIPKTLCFEVHNHYTDISGEKVNEAHLVFNEQGKDAPCTDNVDSSIIKSQLIWWEVHVRNEKEFTLYRPHWFGLVFSFAGGTPVVSTLKRSELN